MKEIIALISVLLVVLLILSLTNSADNNEAAADSSINELEIEVEKYTWNGYQNSDITLNGNSISLSGGGAVVSGRTIPIKLLVKITISAPLKMGR